MNERRHDEHVNEQKSEWKQRIRKRKQEEEEERLRQMQKKQVEVEQQQEKTHRSSQKSSTGTESACRKTGGA